MDYDFKEYRDSDVVKMDILINGDRVDTLSVIVHRANSQFKGRDLAAKLRELIQGRCLMLQYRLPSVSTSLPVRM